MTGADPVHDGKRAATSVGIGWRPELAADLLAAREAVDLVEVVAEICFVQPAAWREACALAEIWPVVPHGVKLSLGSADGIDVDRARELGRLARELHAPAITEHVAITRAGSREIGHLTTLPFTREAVQVLARNVERARRVLPDVPFLLENVAWTLRWPGDSLREGDFYCEIVEATGCDLLLDVANLYANAVNSRLSPSALLRSYPLERVGMIHLAGGIEEDGFYVDTHAHAVPQAVFDLLTEVLDRVGRVPVILERDARFPRFEELAEEIGRARRALATTKSPSCERRAGRKQDGLGVLDAGPLGREQERLADLLTRSDEPEPEAARCFGEEAITRTRAILHHKRVDDAVPLLPRTAPQGDRLREVALEALRVTQRAPHAAGIADAVRIAEAAAADPVLAVAARIDQLELRARFEEDHRPRRGPFLGSATLPDGARVWAFKGFGRDAVTRVWEPRTRR